MDYILGKFLRFCFLSAGWHSSYMPKWYNLQDTQTLWQHKMSPLKTALTMFLIIIIIITLHYCFCFLSCSVISWPFELVQELCLLLLLKTNACRAVGVIMGEVGGSFILRVFQTHFQPSNANSSVYLAEAEKSKHWILGNLTYKANLRASSLPLNFKVHLTISQCSSEQNGTSPKHGRGNQIMKTSFRPFNTDIHCIYAASQHFNSVLTKVKTNVFQNCYFLAEMKR